MLTEISSLGQNSSLILSSQAQTPDSITWQRRFRVHQSTVKSMTVVTLPDRSLLFFTGGDDNAVSVTRVHFVRNNQAIIPAYSTVTVSNAHASAVTAVTALPLLESTESTASTDFANLPLRFATASNDQRVKIWEVAVDMNRTDVEALKIRKKATMHTSVADASSLGVLEDSSGVCEVVVCGVGMETFNIPTTCS